MIDRQSMTELQRVNDLIVLDCKPFDVAAV